MSYKLKSLTIENFVVFVDKQTIDFSQKELNLVEGIYLNNETQSNGAGKSLILDAISLALFGKGIRASYISDYISASNPNGGIYIGLEISNGPEIIKIERWKRPNSDTNKAKVWKNGLCISQDSTITKIDENIQSIIGINHTNFLSCVFSVMLLGFTKLRPAQRFEILEHALAVKKIESVIKKINASIKVDEDTISSTASVINDRNNSYTAEKTKKDIYSSNIDSIKDTIASHKEELESFQQREKDIANSLSDTKAVISECIKQLSPLELVSKEIISTKRSKEITKNSVILRKNAVLKAFKKNSHGVLECSVCKSSLTEHSKASIQEHYDLELATLDTEIASLASQIEEKSQKISKIALVQEKAEKNYSKLANSMSFIQTNMLALEKALLNNSKSLEIASSSFNEELLVSLKTELSELGDTVKKAEKQLKIDIAWKNIMSKNGLRLAYIKEEVATLNALASKYATAIYDEPIQIKFFINDEKDNPSLEFTVNGKNAAMFSTGERGRLEIAMTLSLMSLLCTAGLQLGFLLIDEVLDGLSESSKLAVMKVITSLSTEYQVIMVSHDPLVKQRDGYVIQVCKDGAANRSTVKTSIRKSQPV